jgi:hypothetical protein
MACHRQELEYAPEFTEGRMCLSGSPRAWICPSLSEKPSGVTGLVPWDIWLP